MSIQDVRRRLGLKAREPTPKEVPKLLPPEETDGKSYLHKDRQADEAARVEIALAAVRKPAPVKQTGVWIRVPPPPLPIQVLRVPPLPSVRASLKQVTVLDHNPQTREPFIRAYVERYSSVKPGDPYYNEARSNTTVFCTRKLDHQIALTACHHYCESPCPEHLTKLHEMGWSRCAPGNQRSK